MRYPSGTYWWVTFLLVQTAACGHEPPTELADNPTPWRVASSPLSSSDLLLANDVRPLLAARFRADSVDSPVGVATVQLRGRAGDKVSLVVNTAVSLLQAVGPEVRLTVEINGSRTTHSLQELGTGISVYEFTMDASVEIHYALTRQVAGAPIGSFFLRQISGATVLSAKVPWVEREVDGSLAGALLCSTDCGPTCEFLAASGECGTTSYTISPYALGYPFCCFQSNPGTGASSVITITFSSPVSNVTITIKDPTYSGNTMAAYGPGGLIESASFSFSGFPGQYSEDTKSISGEITSIVLTPASADYVSYSGTFTMEEIVVTCDSSTVPRGGTVSCVASPKNPAAILAVSGWSFTSTSGQRVDRTNNVTSTSWGGVLAIGGTIAVEGTVDGSVALGSVSVQVTARTWSLTTIKNHMVTIPTTLQDRPPDIHGLGNAIVSLPLDANVNRWLAPIADDGPNHDFFYLIDLPPKTTSTSQVNTNAISGTSDFYQVQEPRRKKINGLWYCPQSVVTGVLYGLVEKHEGAVTDPDVYPNSHPAIFRQHVDAKANQRYEPLAGFGAQDVVSPVTNTLFNEAYNDTQAMDNDSRNYINYQSLGNCETFHFVYPP